MGVVVDTSVWIDFFNGVDSTQTTLLSGLIQNDFPIWITATILQELLQGFQSDSDFNTARSLLLAHSMAEADPVMAAIGAASLYRSARKKGQTIRKSNDCLIAWHCIYLDLPILHKDRDFDSLSTVSNLKIFKGV